MVTLEDIRSAQARLKGVTVHTPLIEFNHQDSGTRQLFLKPENQQPIGAFNFAEPTTRSPSFPKRTGSAALLLTPAEITRKALLTRRGR